MMSALGFSFIKGPSAEQRNVYGSGHETVRSCYLVLKPGNKTAAVS